MADFSADIAKFVEKAGDNIDGFVREFNQGLAEAVQDNTPFKTGFLRGSWTAAIGAPDFGNEADGTEKAVVSVVLQGVKAGDIVYHTNNAKYGPRIEFGFTGPDSLGRVYSQEGYGFVRKTIAQADEIAKKAIERLQK